MNATDDVIAKINTDMMRFAQQSIKEPNEYAKELWNKAITHDRYTMRMYGRAFLLPFCLNRSATVRAHIEVQ